MIRLHEDMRRRREEEECRVNPTSHDDSGCNLYVIYEDIMVVRRSLGVSRNDRNQGNRNQFWFF